MKSENRVICTECGLSVKAEFACYNPGFVHRKHVMDRLVTWQPYLGWFCKDCHEMIIQEKKVLKQSW